MVVYIVLSAILRAERGGGGGGRARERGREQEIWGDMKKAFILLRAHADTENNNVKDERQYLSLGLSRHVIHKHNRQSVVMKRHSGKAADVQCTGASLLATIIIILKEQCIA